MSAADRSPFSGSVPLHSEGRIAAVGPNETVLAAYPESSFEHVLDASGRVLLPGLVDGHTHPVWAGDRVNEFAMKVRRGKMV